jgi:hyaluronan synthase
VFSYVFDEVLRRILAQHPDEVYVVINGPRNQALETVCHAWAPRVRWEWTSIADKRHAEAIGLRRTSAEIVTLVDSDTFWTETAAGAQSTLRELLKPFSDPRVGGVTTHQIIRNADTNLVTRFAAWLEACRWLFSVPAQSVFGQVGVLPGRTIAFRREILLRCLDDFLNEPLRISDDRSQTMHAIAQGYHTVYQRTSVVETLAPESLPRFFRQQLRWSKGSQHNTLRWLGMMVRRCPYAAFQFCVEIITPFLFLAVVIHGVRNFSDSPNHNAFHAILGVQNQIAAAVVSLLLIALSWSLTALIRQFPLIRKRPSELLLAPAYAALALLILVPTRILGLFIANLPVASGWGTRKGALGGERSFRWFAFASIYPALLGLALLAIATFVGLTFS